MSTLNLRDRTLSRRSMIGGSAALAAGAVMLPRGEHGVAMAWQNATPAPADRQVIRWAGTSQITRMSIVGYTQFMYENLQNLFLTPFVQDADGNIQPGLCLDYSVTDDGLVYTLQLDPDARWSDGSKVTADDVKFTWDYMASPASENPFTYYQTSMVVGHADVVSGSATEIAGLRVVDEETLEVTLDRPFTAFIDYCTHCFLGVHQKKNIVDGGAEWDRKPTVSCGPYVIESHNPDTGEIVCVRNPHWWRSQPVVERLEYRWVQDSNTLTILWDNDEIDVFRALGSTPVDAIVGPLAEYTIQAPCLETFFLLLDTRRAPFDDINVRRAILKASDVEGAVNAVLRGAWEPASGILHPETPGAERRPAHFDPDGARAALAASSYAEQELPQIVMAMLAGSLYGQIGEIIQQSWRDVLGIDPASLPTDAAFNPDEIGAQVRSGGNTSLFLGPGALLTWGWHADNSHFGLVGVKDEEVEALLNQGDTLPRDQVAERAAAYQAAEDLILDRAYAIPLTWGKTRYFVKPWVANARFLPSMAFDPTNVFIAER